MQYIVSFNDQTACQKDLVGGKAVNLGLLTKAGFQVPHGFTITTDAYTEFLSANGLSNKIEELLHKLVYNDAQLLEHSTSQIRDSILQSSLSPALQTSIVNAYCNLRKEHQNQDVYVAVRSSGTAEDLAEASFAGLHDTILDVKGIEGLLTAVKSCFASLFSARAVAYRERNGFNHLEAKLAVVVQQMVASEVSGVMFTANPISTATDEIVINASWGLGEAVVSSLVDPDTYIVKTGHLRVRSKTCGSKERTIRRNTTTGTGTIEEQTPASYSERFCFNDEQATQLARLGLRVQTHYGGFPQDIEWAYESGEFFVLQSRPITGIEFSWDVDCEDYQIYPDKDDVVWTRTQADESWSGAISPLFYSCRASSWDAGHQRGTLMWGIDSLKKQRYWKFHKATAYYNCEIERGLLENTVPHQLRGDLLAHVPPIWRDDIMAKPFSWWTWFKTYARIELFLPQLYASFSRIDVYWRNVFSTEGRGMSRDSLKDLSDDELKRYLEYFIQMECEWNISTWSFWFIYCRDMMTLLHWLVKEWYDSTDAVFTYQSLITGSKRPTETIKAQHMLYKMSCRIRESAELKEQFEKHPGSAFFEICKTFEDGIKFLQDYKAFIDFAGQRGMPDRDMSFARRCEDSSIDYRALASMLTSADAIDPSIKEKESDQIREDMAKKVIAKIRGRPFGLFKAEFFKIVYDWCLEFICTRDDERHHLDKLTLTWRFGFLEVGRRLTERGVFQEPDQVWWLGRRELWPLLFGAPLSPLLQAKMKARRRDFDQMLAREIEQPVYLKNGAAVDLEIHPVDERGVFRGSGTARGKKTGRANVVRQLKDIGKVKEGDILVVNATGRLKICLAFQVHSVQYAGEIDPGWTPVFHIISGIILETGGILSHGACLARECGLPAVQLPSAMNKIPDGAWVSIDGSLGTITLVESLDGQSER